MENEEDFKEVGNDDSSSVSSTNENSENESVNGITENDEKKADTSSISSNIENSESEQISGTTDNDEKKIDDVKNGKYNKANSGKEAFQKGLGNKDYYKNLKKDAQDRINDTKGNIKKASNNKDQSAERLKKARDDNRMVPRSQRNLEDKNNLDSAKKEDKESKNKLDGEKNKLKQDKKNLRNIKRDGLKSKAYAATHPGDAAAMAVKAVAKRAAKKILIAAAPYIAGFVLGFVVIIFIIELILGPLMDAWGNIDEAITGVANFSEKNSNFYSGFGFKDSKEAFYDELDSLCDRYGCDNNNNGDGLNVPLLLSTIFYTESAGYDTDYQNIEDESAVDQTITSGGTNSSLFSSLKAYAKDKFKEAHQTVGEDGLVYNVGKIYRLRKLARNQFHTDIFGNATREGQTDTVSLSTFLAKYGSMLGTDLLDFIERLGGSVWSSVTSIFSELWSYVLDVDEYKGSFFEDSKNANEEAFHSMTQLIGDIFYGIADITDISWSFTNACIEVTYVSGYQFDEDNYKNYLMNYYFMNMPEFHSYIGGLTDDALEQKKEMLYKDIVANEGLFRDIFLRNTSGSSEEYSETCVGAIDSALVSELGKPVNIADGVTVNFDTNYSFGIVNGKNHNGVDLNETTAGVKAGDSVYSVAKGKVESITDAKCGENTCGKSVKISHDVTINEKEYKFITIYSNVKPISTLKEGLTVNKGDAIASIDSSENNTEGLHFTFMDALQDSNGTAIDPTNLFIPCGALTGSLKRVGPEAEPDIWNYLLSLGYTKAGAAGMMGNFFQESTYYPDIVNGDEDHLNTEYAKKVASGEISKEKFTGTLVGTSCTNYAPGDGGFGIAGFTWCTLKEALYDFKGKEYVADLETQLLFLDISMKEPETHGISPGGEYKELYKLLKSTDDVSKAASEFLIVYEYGGRTHCRNQQTDCNKEIRNRTANAQRIYNTYAK